MLPSSSCPNARLLTTRMAGASSGRSSRISIGKQISGMLSILAEQSLLTFVDMQSSERTSGLKIHAARHRVRDDATRVVNGESSSRVTLGAGGCCAARTRSFPTARLPLTRFTVPSSRRELRRIICGALPRRDPQLQLSSFECGE
jgi:hypothetical protein